MNEDRLTIRQPSSSLQIYRPGTMTPLVTIDGWGKVTLHEGTLDEAANAFWAAVQAAGFRISGNRHD